MIAPKVAPGGIVAEIRGKSYPLLLRNAEIERFEAQYNLGIYDFLAQLGPEGETGPQSRHVRDIVALGLVGAGKKDRAADQIMSATTPGDLFALRTIAFDLVAAAFLLSNQKKEEPGDGSPPPTGQEADGTSPPE